MEIFTVTAKNTPRMDSFLLEKLPALSIGKLNKYLRENGLLPADHVGNNRVVSEGSPVVGQFGNEVVLFCHAGHYSTYPHLNNPFKRSGIPGRVDGNKIQYI